MGEKAPVRLPLSVRKELRQIEEKKHLPKGSLGKGRINCDFALTSKEIEGHVKRVGIFYKGTNEGKIT